MTRRMWYMQLSGDDIKSLPKTSTWSRLRCTYNRDWSQLNNCQNFEFGHPVLHISLMEVVSHVPPSPFCQCVKPDLLLPKTLHARLYSIGHYAHHPARFVIFPQLAKLCIVFIIFLIIPILPIIRTCNIAQTVSDNIQDVLKWFFALSRCRSRHFSISHIFLL